MCVKTEREIKRQPWIDRHGLEEKVATKVELLASETSTHEKICPVNLHSHPSYSRKWFLSSEDPEEVHNVTAKIKSMFPRRFLNLYRLYTMKATLEVSRRCLWPTRILSKFATMQSIVAQRFFTLNSLYMSVSGLLAAEQTTLNLLN
mmetsp:Transcript_20923/g.50379  ORF Transcript_20923/g.50379 Transcript_20923/m.50379 type:complete len:147 (+) Transcript_20923:618-1058(+)